MATTLQRVQGAVCRIRLRAGDSLPAAEALGPVPLTVAQLPHELRVPHRLLVLPFPVVVTIVGNPRGRAAAGPGENRGSGMLNNEIRKPLGRIAGTQRQGVASEPERDVVVFPFHREGETGEVP